MKTYKEDNYRPNNSIDPYISNYSKIIKESNSSITIREGRVIIYRPRNERGPGSPGHIQDDTVSTPIYANSIFTEDNRYIGVIPELSGEEITESSSVYIKIGFNCSSGWGSLIDLGFLDGSKDTTPGLSLIYGLLSQKTYAINENAVSYVVAPIGETIVDSDDESQIYAGNTSYSGYFHIKIADIIKTGSKIKIKQYQRGQIEITPPVIYYDAYSLTQY